MILTQVLGLTSVLVHGGLKHRGTLQAVLCDLLVHCSVGAGLLVPDSGCALETPLVRADAAIVGAIAHGAALGSTALGLLLLGPAVVVSALVRLDASRLLTSLSHLVLGRLPQGRQLLGKLHRSLFELLLLFLVEVVILIFVPITGRVLTTRCVTVIFIIIVFQLEIADSRLFRGGRASVVQRSTNSSWFDSGRSLVIKLACSATARHFKIFVAVIAHFS